MKFLVLSICLALVICHVDGHRHRHYSCSKKTCCRIDLKNTDIAATVNNQGIKNFLSACLANQDMTFFNRLIADLNQTTLTRENLAAYLTLVTGLPDGISIARKLTCCYNYVTRPRCRYWSCHYNYDWVPSTGTSSPANIARLNFYGCLYEQLIQCCAVKSTAETLNLRAIV